ncbi:unnamed protein product [Vicia faba]|uniref:Uncharacterized protein n=1 Tax=Vicia faba TaxID=3906 RepID=A0AAV1AXH3_VICFA|nr:unnamed protein product [Vicia faba]
MTITYTEGSSSQEVELMKLWAKLAAVKKGRSDEEKARKLVEEDLGKLSEERSVWLLEKKALENRVVILTVEVTLVEDIPEDKKDLKTQAELVARFQLPMDDAQAASKGRFENALKQLRVLNHGVELNASGMGVNYYVASRKILVPDYLEELAPSPRGNPLNYRLFLRKGMKSDV